MPFLVGFWFLVSGFWLLVSDLQAMGEIGLLEDGLNRTPLAALAGGALGLMLLAAVAGMALRAHQDRRAKAPRSDDQEGYIVTAVLGLLALLLAFTFALTVDRFEARRRLVFEESNAIKTTYLRAQLLDEPHRTRISRLLIGYTNNRIAMARASPGRARIALAEANDRFITELWVATSAAFDSIKHLDFSNSFLESMNRLIDLNAARRAERLAHVPALVFAVLLTYLVVTAGVLGYVLVGWRGRGAACFMLLLLLLSLVLVIDLDRPVGGVQREDQAPMERLRAALAKQPPGSFDRLRER
jgi:hypothetical protein